MPDYLPVYGLYNGDGIGLFSPSQWLDSNSVEQVKTNTEILRQAGFEIQHAQNYLAQDGIRAGTTQQRLADISELLDRADIQALLATWGGKACNHLVPYLPYAAIREVRKPVIGFSDVTVLLNAITAVTGLVTFHGPNNAGQLNDSIWSNLAALRPSFDWQNQNLLAGAAAAGGLSLRSGMATGRLFGGNLNCFVLGVAMSKVDLSYFDNGIFFWEDIGLAPRQIDQFLTALVNVGFMDRINGMIVGDFFTEESSEWLRSNPLDSVMNALRNYDFPIVYAPVFGHQKLENPVLPIGAHAVLNSRAITLSVTDEIIIERL